MLTQELKEKKQRFLQEIQEDVIQATRAEAFRTSMVKDYVVRALLLLQDDKYDRYWEAWNALLSAYRCLFILPDKSCLRNEHMETISIRWDELAKGIHKLAAEFEEAVCILDRGLFAFRLSGSFFYLHDVAQCLWKLRGVFQPHLSGALRAAYWFRCLIEEGREPAEALSIALRVRNELYEAFGDTYVYRFRDDISMLLNPDAIAKLRQILMGMLNNPHDHTK
jgi:hypothetical protein